VTILAGIFAAISSAASMIVLPCPRVQLKISLAAAGCTAAVANAAATSVT
jgi:hypothetical protein